MKFVKLWNRKICGFLGALKKYFFGAFTKYVLFGAIEMCFEFINCESVHF